MILHEIFHVVLRFPRYISCYIAESAFPLEKCRVCYSALLRIHYVSTTSAKV